jgi:hypothetical protein
VRNKRPSAKLLAEARTVAADINRKGTARATVGADGVVTIHQARPIPIGIVLAGKPKAKPH